MSKARPKGKKEGRRRKKKGIYEDGVYAVERMGGGYNLKVKSCFLLGKYIGLEYYACTGFSVCTSDLLWLQSLISLEF